MTLPNPPTADLPSPPVLTAGTVFFIGNGALRVAEPMDPSSPDDRSLGPSWAEYMDRLWEFAEVRAGSSRYLGLEDFSQLTTPRQAEWFDRNFRPRDGAEVSLPVVRLHLLGQSLHSSANILSNPLLRELARLITLQVNYSQSRIPDIDVITTNVDCALEQNIARAIDQIAHEVGASIDTTAGGPRTGGAVIETIVDFRSSARWERSAGGFPNDFRVRLWKLHGCLRDLKGRVPADVARSILALPGNTGSDLCGQVPMEHLAANLTGTWQQTLPVPIPGLRYSYSGVFSQSEYFRNLLVLAKRPADEDRNGDPHSGDSQSGDPDFPYHLSDEQRAKLREFCELLAARPLIFVGYSIPDVDVDVVYALQEYLRRDEPVKRWHLSERRERSPSGDERLHQMGIEPWTFEVRSTGFASIPGKLHAARRHEWRLITHDKDAVGLPTARDWRRALQRLGAEAWLEPQMRALRSLAPVGRSGEGAATSARNRLVVLGLGTIWHGFALTKREDFPAPRRVSARLVSVDAQVPGGSGLVPAMVAAAAAGPAAVGSMTFFSNSPREWASWNEIEDFCLSAGIAVHPWTPDIPGGESGTESVGRTSHVIFFDPSKDGAGLRPPRQRFIMDVQALANEAMASNVTDWALLKVPPARVEDGFQAAGQEDFLFMDKEADPSVILGWKGPTVYETGTSGDELTTVLPNAGAKPTIWTAGLGSFMRTMVALAGRVPDGPIFRGGPELVVEHLAEDPRLAPFTRCQGLRERYLAKVIGFGQAGVWDFGGVGFTYQEELAYGRWLQECWHPMESDIWSLIHGHRGGVLGEPHPRIGGGLLTTIHEGGLMALWHWRGGRRESFAVKVATSTQGDQVSIVVTCDGPTTGRDDQVNPIHIRIDPEEVRLNIAGQHGRQHPRLVRSDPIRWNTLGAGDTVRGVLAYGLWRAAYQQGDDPVSIERILLASAALATLKCYGGSFVDFLRLLEKLRGSAVWNSMWGIA